VIPGFKDIFPDTKSEKYIEQPHNGSIVPDKESCKFCCVGIFKQKPGEARN
jgi:hypothetical protein